MEGWNYAPLYNARLEHPNVLELLNELNSSTHIDSMYMFITRISATTFELGLYDIFSICFAYMSFLRTPLSFKPIIYALAPVYISHLHSVLVKFILILKISIVIWMSFYVIRSTTTTNNKSITYILQLIISFSECEIVQNPLTEYLMKINIVYIECCVWPVEVCPELEYAHRGSPGSLGSPNTSIAYI